MILIEKVKSEVPELNKTFIEFHHQFKEQKGYPFLGMVMQPGEMVIINDKTLWHSAKPIRTIDIEHNGYMDAFILTAG